MKVTFCMRTITPPVTLALFILLVYSSIPGSIDVIPDQRTQATGSEGTQGVVVSRVLREDFNEWWGRIAPLLKSQKSITHATRMGIEGTQFDRIWWRELDLMQKTPPNLDPHFRNPCWWSEKQLDGGCHSEQWTPRHPASNQRTPRYPASNQRTPRHPASNQRTPRYPASNQRTPRHPASNQRTPRYPASNQRTPIYPASNQRTPRYPASNQRTPIYPASNQRTPRYPASNQTSLWLRCLPYYLVIGQMKCGTSDIWAKIKDHPEVVPPSFKELHWFDQLRLHNATCSMFDSYIEMFQAVANTILQQDQPGTVNRYITGEATPNYLTRLYFWKSLPHNGNLSEPKVTNADHIRQLLPWVKLIVSLRNPSDRLFSDYLHVKHLKRELGSLREFHESVKDKLEEFKTCLKIQTLRACCFNERSGKIHLSKGIYHVFLKDWFEVFPRGQIHIIRFEDYAANTTHHLKNIFSFLQLKTLSATELRKISERRPKNKRSSKERSIGYMWPTTRKILDGFYEPFNSMLAGLLNDERYLWRQ